MTLLFTEKQLQTSVAQKDAAEGELERLERSVEEKTVQVQQQEEKVNELNEQYKKFKSLLEHKGFSVSRRQNTSTTYDMVTISILVLDIDEDMKPKMS